MSYQDSASVHRTPIIKLWDVLLVPLQGEVTDRQAELLTSDVLEKIRQTGARGLVVDLSAMWMVDSHLCAVLAKLSRSARMMGTRPVLAGMSPDVALTLQSMGIELKGMESALGLEQAMELLQSGAESESAADDSLSLDALLGDSPRPTLLSGSSVRDNDSKAANSPARRKA